MNKEAVLPFFLGGGGSLHYPSKLIFLFWNKKRGFQGNIVHVYVCINPEKTKRKRKMKDTKNNNTIT